MRYLYKVCSACIVLGWIAIVCAFCYLAILFWHLLLFWLVSWPGDLSTQKERATVALGGPAVYAGVHFWAFAYIKLWLLSDVTLERSYRRNVIRLGISLYLITHMILVIAIAVNPGAFFLAFLEHFHGEPGQGHDIVAIVWFVFIGLGTVALLTTYRPGKEALESHAS